MSVDGSIELLKCLRFWPNLTEPLSVQNMFHLEGTIHNRQTRLRVGPTFYWPRVQLTLSKSNLRYRSVNVYDAVPGTCKCGFSHEFLERSLLNNLPNIATALSHDQFNIRLEKGGWEVVWISYRLETGFCGEPPGQIPRNFTCTIQIRSWDKSKNRCLWEIHTSSNEPLPEPVFMSINNQQSSFVITIGRHISHEILLILILIAQTFIAVSALVDTAV